jgi:hypothetical protein
MADDLLNERFGSVERQSEAFERTLPMLRKRYTRSGKYPFFRRASVGCSHFATQFSARAGRIPRPPWSSQGGDRSITGLPVGSPACFVTALGPDLLQGIIINCLAASRTEPSERCRGGPTSRSAYLVPLGRGGPISSGRTLSPNGHLLPRGGLCLSRRSAVAATETVDGEPGRGLDRPVVPKALLDDIRLSRTAMRYYAVAMQEPAIEMETIAQRINASSKTAQRARAALLSTGWMEIVTTRGPQGSRTEHRCLPAPTRLAS